MVEIKQKIETSIKAIRDGDLFTSTLSLFNSLGYNTKRQSRLDNTTYDEFEKSFLKHNDNIRDIAKFKEKAYTDDWLKIELLFQLTDMEMGINNDLFDTVKFDNTIINAYLFFAIDLKKDKYTRTQLSDMTRQVNKVFSMPVMILFKHGDEITLSIIKRRLNKKDESRDVLEKVTLIKDINTINSHRAHIEIFFDLSLDEIRKEYTVTNFVELQTAWQKILDLKKLNEKFYEEVSTWYYYAIKEIKLPLRPEFYKDDKENTKHFSVRLISRLLFSWFLKEMGLIDKKLLELKLDNIGLLFNDTPENKLFLNQNSYYRSVLQNIFFSSLNTPQNERKAFYYEKQLSVDIDLFKKIPYLNGGLFEKLEEDNCNDRIEDSKIRIPNELFYAEEISVKVDKKEKKTKGLNKIFEHYKFTVDENTSFEEEVALDPELLGLIFENLLAEIDPNDNVSKTAKKATGSFYTPRKIIDYMVNESLLLYFKNFFSNNKSYIKDIEELIYYEKCTDDITFKNKIINAIDEIKVLDPACGSGAFPMGMLHKLVRILKVVDESNHLWIEKQINRLPIELREQTRKDLIRHEFNYSRKLGIIRNSIYSIDIQPMAVMISKLRFFISLLIEQDIDLKGAEHNYHISPLPNLETKIICANTLKDTSFQVDMFTDQTIEVLIEAKEKYYQNSNLSIDEKSSLLITIIDALNSVYPDFAQEITGKLESDKLSKELENKKYLREWFKHSNISAPFFNMDIFYPELAGGGFDIVIGNPPYGGDKIPDEVKNNLELGSKDPYGAFIARFLGNGFSMESDGRRTPLKTNGILSYIVSDTFMTIKTHLPLRKQMINNKIHKMIRVHPDTFKATVNTAVILCEKQAVNSVSEKGIENSHICTMADLTTVSIHDNHDRFVELLYQTTESEVTEVIETEGDKLPVLRMKGENWTSESSEEYAIYTYPQNLINTNSNTPFFVASPKLFGFMNDNNDLDNRVRLDWKKINDEKVQVRTIKFNEKNIEIVKLGDISEVKRGIDTGKNDEYLFQKKEARGNYQDISTLKDKIISTEELREICKTNEIRERLIKEGFAQRVTDKYGIYFNGKYIIPFDKGGESDAKKGFIPNYYIETDYYINWSNISVKSLYERAKFSTAKANLRNPRFWFLNGITYSARGVYSPSYRLNSASIFDSNGSSLFPLDDTSKNVKRILILLVSKLNRYSLKNFCGHTIASEVDELKEIPIYYEYSTISKTLDCIDSIIEKQKENPRYDYANNEQIEIDNLVYEAYGLNSDDIKEVENWYTRRYPNLKQTKKSGLEHEVIEKLKKQKKYFSYENIKALLEEEKLEITPSSLKSYVFELVHKGIIFDAGKGWYSSIEKEFNLNTKPVESVIRKIKKSLPLLEFSCWSTEQINSYTHHILSRFIVFIYTESDFIRNTAEVLIQAGYKVYENPNKDEIEKYFRVEDKTVVILPSITKQPESINNFSPIEKLLIDLHIENNKFKIMENSEVDEVIIKAINSGRINISAMNSYAKRRNSDVLNTINQVQ
ncbi:MAG: hypothetical protein PF638_09695 [Candidatus Delongbacteria bacterium]|jgi:hypothetical protein|nr:hypothetical protein [Candidatus Delongbacteria bacterium]